MRVPLVSLDRFTRDGIMVEVKYSNLAKSESAESARFAEKEGAAAEAMAGDIVPESAKSAKTDEEAKR